METTKLVFISLLIFSVINAVAMVTCILHFRKLNNNIEETLSGRVDIIYDVLDNNNLWHDSFSALFIPTRNVECISEKIDMLYDYLGVEIKKIPATKVIAIKSADESTQNACP